MTYGKLMSDIWTNHGFNALNPQQQQLYMLLISYPTRNHAGVLPLTLRRWARATAMATPDNVRGALIHLAETRFVVLDWDTEEVLVRTFIRNDEVYRQPKVMKCALREALEVASPILRAALSEELARLPKHADDKDTAHAVKTLVETPQEGYGQGYGQGYDDSQGVGSYVSEVCDTPTPTPENPPPTPAADTHTCTQPPRGVSQGVALVEDVKAKRAHRLPEDWRPSSEVIDRMKIKHPALDLWAEFEKFQNHHIGRGTKWVDWNRAWWNWIAGSAERRGTVQIRNSHNGQPMTGTERSFARIDSVLAKYTQPPEPIGEIT